MNRPGRRVLSLFWITSLCIASLGSAWAQSGQNRPTPKERWPDNPPQNPNSQNPQTSSGGKKKQGAEAEQEGVIKLRSDLVTVTTTVTGGAGELIGNLGREDFEVFEDGSAQKIESFGRSNVPLSLIVIFDASLSVRSRLDFEKQAVARFLRTTLRPVDRAAILSVSTDIVWRQELTSNLELLLAAVRSIAAEGATALYDAVNTAATRLLDSDGRRIIAVLSDGRDTISRATLAEALRNVQKADAVIYGINTGGAPASANVRDLAGERALETMADHTGGEVFFPNRLEDLEPAFARLGDQLRTQYVLGYYSTNESRDGAFRHVVVRVKRPGAYARARQGYYAPKA